MTPIFEARDLFVQFSGVVAVRNVSFSVEKGTVTGLIGPNGAGKTTLMDAVTGMVRAKGQVLLEGRDISGFPPHKRVRSGLARTFQSLELFEDLTVRENLAVAAEYGHWWSPLTDLFRPRLSGAGQQAVDNALETMRLTDIADEHPTNLSLGLRKLVTIARALAAQPSVLLLDEPAAGLDSSESLKLGAELRELAQSGLAIIIIDHDMDLMLSVCDQVNVLNFGELIASGTPEQVRTDARVIGAYLGSDEEDASESDLASAKALAHAEEAVA